MSYVCKDCAYDYQKAGYAVDPSEQKLRQRSYSLKSKFGITLEDFNDLLKDQGGVCASCGTDVPGGNGLIRKLMYLVRHGSLPSEETKALLGSFLNMKQTFVAWLCLAALVLTNSGCPNPHTAERIDNASISAQHDAALNECVNDAIASVQVGEDFDKVQAEYNACADAADKKYGVKNPSRKSFTYHDYRFYSRGTSGTTR